MSSDKLVWLISGTSRGIGLALVTKLLLDPRNIVFAGVRSASSPGGLKELTEKKENEGRLFVLGLPSDEEEEAREAARVVEEKVGWVDIVIANAGIASYFGPVATTPVHEYESHWRTNTLGIVILFQAMHPLLLKSPTKTPKFIPISTGGASMAKPVPLENGPYGSSKAAVNFIAKRIAIEGEKDGLIAFPLSPGWVATDLGNHGARTAGMKAAPITTDQSVEGIIDLVTKADASHSGRFLSYDGSELQW